MSALCLRFLLGMHEYSIRTPEPYAYNTTHGCVLCSHSPTFLYVSALKIISGFLLFWIHKKQKCTKTDYSGAMCVAHEHTPCVTRAASTTHNNNATLLHGIISHCFSIGYSSKSTFCDRETKLVKKTFCCCKPFQKNIFNTKGLSRNHVMASSHTIYPSE